MNLPHFFIDRPIFATVISLVITLLGVVAYFSLPVAQYPAIAPPTIQVSANYPGASAEVVADTVATPIEQEINGVENMLYAVSQATGDGALTITVTFKLGTDLDEAQVLVQNRVAIAEPRLPEPVRRLGITTQKSSPDLMMVIHMYSDDGTRDQLYVSNYARTQVVDRLARIDGVGQARLFAERAYSMRIWLDPELIAARAMTAGEVVAALRANNVQVASGTINRLPVPNPGAYEIAVETQGRLLNPEQFEEIVVKTGEDGAQVRVKDIARVELGALDYSTIGYLDQNAALPILIFQRPGSNALETAENVLGEMKELSEAFPVGVAYDVIYNPTEFIEKSVNAVYKTLIEAILLVVLVIIFFLHSLRAALIPIIAIPVSLIGTFAVMAAFGFSLNNLTLFGLVLAIGIVVDDAIVVVENVERYLRQGKSPREATRITMTEVSGALIATSLVMMAVFIPASFVSGISGQFFRQFALTIAVSTAISTVVSLTLSPALAALLLRPHQETDHKRGLIGSFFHALAAPMRWFSRGFNYTFDKIAGGYSYLVRGLIRVSVVMLIAYVGLSYLGYSQFQKAPRGFIPNQNLGYLITVIQLPPGASLVRTDAVVQRAIKLILEHKGTAHTAGFAGFSGATFTNASNAGAIFFTLKDFDELARLGLTQDQILNEVQGSLASIKEAVVFIVAPPPVRGIGSTGGWKLYVQDQRGRGSVALEAATQQLVGAANQTPGLARVFTQFDTATPRLYANIDRVKAEKLGVTPDQIFETLEVYLGSAFVNDFNFLGRTFRVTAQADGKFRDDPADVANLRTRTATGGMMPIGSVATFEQTTGPYRVPRYNLFPAAAVQGSTTPGTSTGEAIAKVEELAKSLPSGFGYEWTELALQEKLAGDSTLIIFGLAVVFVFLVLAAQYESWLLPLSVILIVPLCLLAAISGVLYRGIDNNILTQIGLIVLVGLASKNAILIVAFAKQNEDEGKSRLEAAVEAARLRLRPILMTSFAFILGVVPLVIATGAGSEMRQALGTAVFSGMLGVTFFGIFFTPVFYVLCRALGALIDRTKKPRPGKVKDAPVV
ncbi:MAG: multidrug efflux RND transporter permease subunit [Rhizobiales bacterium]|nr:multidrug efflux RND transporter permease subunit [Hyphomicrobiales bacterium]